VQADEVNVAPEGVSFALKAAGDEALVQLALSGEFNVYNALGAAACGLGLGLDTETVVTGLEQLQAVPGRFERIDRGQDFAVIVDYAHTPDALRNVLTAARKLGPKRLISVFGCGGDRDQGKRPLMGKASIELADLTVITSDNPRSEDPLDIVRQIEAGAAGGSYAVEPDRRAAIEMAVNEAQSGDMVIVAGKGHETYQEFADHTIDFDDRLVAAEAIDRRLAQEQR